MFYHNFNYCFSNHNSQPDQSCYHIFIHTKSLLQSLLSSFTIAKGDFWQLQDYKICHSYYTT